MSNTKVTKKDGLNTMELLGSNFRDSDENTTRNYFMRIKIGPFMRTKFISGTPTYISPYYLLHRKYSYCNNPLASYYEVQF